jgi:LysM repeat protein
MIVVLLLSACSSAKNGETATPTATVTATMETRVAPTYTPYPTQTPQPTYTPMAAQPSALAGTPTPTGTSGPVRTPTGTPIRTSTPNPPTPDAPDHPRSAPAVYIVRAGDSLAAIARAYGVTVAAIAEANHIQDVNAILVGQELAIPDPARVPTGPIVQSRPPVKDGGQTAVTLEQIPDTDPGPPITIQVSTVRIKENGNYQITGWVRNDGAQVYGGIGVIATFFTELECGEYHVPNRGRKDQTGSGSDDYGCAPNWHGPVEVYAACSLLAPGEACPFSLEIYPRDYTAYHLHPEGAPVAYQPASLDLSDLSVRQDNFGYLHITGTATNGNPFAVRDAYIFGTLVDAVDQIASVGMTLAPGKIAPGAGVAFELRIEGAPYVHYEVRAQATQN